MDNLNHEQKRMGMIVIEWLCMMENPDCLAANLDFLNKVKSGQVANANTLLLAYFKLPRLAHLCAIPNLRTPCHTFAFYERSKFVGIGHRD